MSIKSTALVFHPKYTRLLAVILLATMARSAIADPAPSTRPTLDVPHAAQPPQLTADAADPAWKDAAGIDGLSMSLGPDAKGLAPLPTQLRLLWDASNLYIRFLCEGPEPYTPEHGHGADLYKGDVAEVFIDPKGDGRQWIELEVSPNNDVLEIVTVLSAEPVFGEYGMLSSEICQRDLWFNRLWDMDGLRTAAAPWRRNDQVVGWVVDMAIPAKPLLRRLGMKAFAPMSLRCNLMRYAYPTPAQEGQPRHLLAMNWSPVRYGCPHLSPAAMGTLVLKKPDAGK